MVASNFFFQLQNGGQNKGIIIKIARTSPFNRVARFFSATAPKFESKSAKMRQKFCWKRHGKRHKFYIICPLFWVFVHFGVDFFTPKNLLLDRVQIFCSFFVFCAFWREFFYCQNFFEILVICSSFLAVFGNFLLSIFFWNFGHFLPVFGRFFVKAPSQ